jgi:hypothetical protein
MKMSKALYFLTFAAGAAIGVTVTWQCARKRFERIAQEEIDSVKESFSQRSEITENMVKATTDADKCEELLRSNGYTNYSGMKNHEENKEAEHRMDEPYIISPEEFGEHLEYETITLTYYFDHILADDNDEIIADAAEIVGTDFPNHFGEYEDDSVFVRNDRMKCDYEILLDRRKYADVTGAQIPYFKGGRYA